MTRPCKVFIPAFFYRVADSLSCRCETGWARHSTEGKVGFRKAVVCPANKFAV